MLSRAALLTRWYGLSQLAAVPVEHDHDHIAAVARFPYKVVVLVHRPGARVGTAADHEAEASGRGGRRHATGRPEARCRCRGR